MSITRDAAIIHDAPSLISLLLAPADAGVAEWRDGGLHLQAGRVTSAAFQDLLTVDVGTRTDLPLLFGRENLDGTLAVTFDQPNETWTQVLDSFFRLWRNQAFPAVAPEKLADSELAALDVLTQAHRRLLDAQAA